MHVYLIRHAQSENNALTEDATGRRKVDPDLTELGYQQRDLLAEFLSSADYEIKHLYTSAMYRSLLTAQPLGDALDIKPKICWTCTKMAACSSIAMAKPADSME